MNLLETMRIFARVVERGSISAAARDLGLGQPAVSERIERLEKFVGCRLLSRSSRAFKCTPEGQLFYERCRSILHITAEAISEISGDSQSFSGTTRIAAPHCFGDIMLPGIATVLRSRFPQMDLELVLNDRAVDLVTEGVDISFRLGELGQGAFIAYPLGQIRRKLVASRRYVEQHGSVLTPAELVAHPFIEGRDSNGTSQLPLVSETGGVENIPVRTIIRASCWRPAFELVMAGLGVGVIEEYVHPEALADGRLVTLLPEFEVQPMDLNLLIQAQRPVSQRVRTIVSLLRSTVPRMLDDSLDRVPLRTDV
jgi:DNA-binding transcriptional LysR family regulator